MTLGGREATLCMLPPLAGRASCRLKVQVFARNKAPDPASRHLSAISIALISTLSFE